MNDFSIINIIDLKDEIKVIKEIEYGVKEESYYPANGNFVDGVKEYLNKCIIPTDNKEYDFLINAYTDENNYEQYALIMRVFSNKKLFVEVIIEGIYQDLEDIYRYCKRKTDNYAANKEYDKFANLKDLEDVLAYGLTETINDIAVELRDNRMYLYLETNRGVKEYNYDPYDAVGIMSNFIGDLVEYNKDNQFNMTEPTLESNGEYYSVKVEMLDENQEIKTITFRGTYVQMQNLYNNSLKHFEKVSLKKIGYDLLKVSSDGQDTAIDSIGGYGISNDDGNMYLGYVNTIEIDDWKDTVQVKVSRTDYRPVITQDYEATGNFVEGVKEYLKNIIIPFDGYRYSITVPTQINEFFYAIQFRIITDTSVKTVVVRSSYVNLLEIYKEIFAVIKNLNVENQSLRIIDAQISQTFAKLNYKAGILDYLSSLSVEKLKQLSDLIDVEDLSEDEKRDFINKTRKLEKENK